MKRFLVQFALSIGWVVLFAHTTSADWVKTNGPGGGRINALAASGSNIFAGTETGGVFLTSNNGANWTQINSGLTDDTVASLAVNGNNVFAGTSGGSVFLSANSGTSWTAVNNGLTNSNVNALAVSGNNVFAGTWGGGIFYSTNNGTSWNRFDAYLLENSKLDVLCIAANGNNIFAGTYQGGMVQTTDNGATWKVASINGYITIFSLAGDGSKIFAGTDLGGPYLSTNNGTSWTPVKNGLTDSAISSLIMSGNNVFAGTVNRGVFLSSNNGANWNPVGLNFCVTSFAVNGSTIFAGNNGGEVWRRSLSEMIVETNIQLQQGMLDQENIKIYSPNHSNHNVNIKFSLPHSDLVTIKIYNLSGKEMISLFNQYVDAGTHSLNFDTRNIATGCYVGRIQVGTNAIVKNILVSR
ncbi:MAG: T9SS type A sorting domain-containing protein [Chitinivibrionales bacterium]|nr:T9SS type A sorting domain-containing protein [Chitinivibrionales bacterium]